MKNQSQNDLIIKHITQYGSITPIDALKRFGCMRLASRINDLRENGFPIVTKTVVSCTTKKRFAKYELEKG